MSSSVQARYLAKLADRASGRVSVQTYPSGPKPGTPGFSSLSAEARYQAKLAARSMPRPDEAKAEPEAALAEPEKKPAKGSARR